MPNAATAPSTPAGSATSAIVRRRSASRDAVDGAVTGRGGPAGSDDPAGRRGGADAARRALALGSAADGAGSPSPVATANAVDAADASIGAAGGVATAIMVGASTAGRARNV